MKNTKCQICLCVEIAINDSPFFHPLHDLMKWIRVTRNRGKLTYNYKSIKLPVSDPNPLFHETGPRVWIRIQIKIKLQNQLHYNKPKIIYTHLQLKTSVGEIYKRES